MRIILVLLVFCCSQVLSAQIPVPALPHYVNDFTGQLSETDYQSLTSLIKSLPQKTQNQLVVLIVPTTAEETIEQFATRVFDIWKPGHNKQDNGILLLVAWQDHTVHIEVGYGLEGTLTDAQAGKIIRTSIIPAFKNGDLAGGLRKGITDIETLLKEDAPVNATPAAQPLPFSGWWALLVWAIILTIISVRGYIKTLGLTCLGAIVLGFALPISGHDGSWGVLFTLLSFATPFLALVIAFTPFGKKLRNAMGPPNQASARRAFRDESKYNSSYHSSSSPSSSDSDSFHDGGGSSGAGGASGRW